MSVGRHCMGVVKYNGLWLACGFLSGVAVKLAGRFAGGESICDASRRPFRLTIRLRRQTYFSSNCNISVSDRSRDGDVRSRHLRKRNRLPGKSACMAPRGETTTIFEMKQSDIKMTGTLIFVPQIFLYEFLYLSVRKILKIQTPYFLLVEFPISLYGRIFKENCLSSLKNKKTKKKKTGVSIDPTAPFKMY